MLLKHDAAQRLLLWCQILVSDQVSRLNVLILRVAVLKSQERAGIRVVVADVFPISPRQLSSERISISQRHGNGHDQTHPLIAI
jgi:hypothetical protein